MFNSYYFPEHFDIDISLDLYVETEKKGYLLVAEVSLKEYVWNHIHIGGMVPL